MSDGYQGFAAVYHECNRDFPYAQVADHYDALIKKFGAPGNILLDIGCGCGELTFLLEQKGYDTVGIDASEEMLSYALEQKMLTGSDSLFLCQKMESLDMFGTMDVTVSLLDCINHLEDETALRRAFEKVHLFGAPGGLFIFDCNTLYKHQKVLAGQNFVYDTEDFYCVWQNTLLDEKTVQMDFDMFFACEEEGIYERMSESFCEVAYPREYLEEMLRDVGFTVLAVYDGFTFDEPKENAERLVFVARINKEGL